MLSSFLDRLLDDEPCDTHVSLPESIEQVRANICRDLENLLNSRRPELCWPLQWHSLSSSLLAYGIPDINGYSLDNHPLKQQFCHLISVAIGYFEPRLQDVNVTFMDNLDDNRLPKLRIEALLNSKNPDNSSRVTLTYSAP